MPYIGNTPTSQSFVPQIDYFNGTGSQTAFTLSRNVASVAQVMVVVNNVPQKPGDAFTVLNNVITFTSAPSAGTGNIYVYYTTLNQQTIQPSYGTVGLNEVAQSVKEAYSSMGFKNRIINGAMMIDQRNAGASVTPVDNAYTLDRWKTNCSQASKFTIQQNAGSVTPPAGFRNYLGVTSSSAYSVGAGDYFMIWQAIEGFNTADFNFGTANASSVTLSFWVRSSLTGTFGGSLFNSAQNRSYPFSYTIGSANTWEQKFLTIAGDTTGTWIGATNGIGLAIMFGLGMGSTYSGAAGSWAGATYYSATGATSVVGTNGATFYITGVQLEKGSTATSFDYRPYGTELALCQRYYTTQSFSVNQWVNNGTGCRVMFYVPVAMRTTPTYTLSNESKSGVSTTFIESAYVAAASGYFLGTSGGNAGGWSGTLTASAEL